MKSKKQPIKKSDIKSFVTDLSEVKFAISEIQQDICDIKDHVMWRRSFPKIRIRREHILTACVIIMTAASVFYAFFK